MLLDHMWSVITAIFPKVFKCSLLCYFEATDLYQDTDIKAAFTLPACLPNKFMFSFRCI